MKSPGLVDGDFHLAEGTVGRRFFLYCNLPCPFAIFFFSLAHPPSTILPGSAILQYVCEKNGLKRWSGELSSAYRDPVEGRARVNEYLSSHHTTSRQISSKVFSPALASLMSKGKKPFTQDHKVESAAFANEEASKFADVWLGKEGGPYVGGFENPTIADLFAYCEFAQATQMRILERYEDDKVDEWIARMKGLDHHDDVHKSLFKLANLFGRVVLK